MPLAPEYAAMLAAAAEAGGPALDEMSPAEGREMYRAMRPAAPEITVGAVRDEQVPGAAGPIPVRIYTPAGDGPFPVLMNFHGGGWVIGDLETSDAISRLFCNAVNCIVVSVDYRLAPEAPYPAAVEDCEAATAWAAQNAATLNANGKLAVTGESAGGNLAAVIAQRALANGGPAICFQLLSYPVVDHDLTRGSYVENGEGYLLSTSSMRWFWDQYCPADRRDEPSASPLKAEGLAGLPPALVMTAEFDPLRDEGQAYAAALQAAGVPTSYQCMDGLIHDFLATSAVLECSKPAFETAAEALRQAFA